MSNEEKTEEATPRRREKEKDKGNIAKSQDFSSSLMLAVGVGAFYTLTSQIFDDLKASMYDTFTQLNPANIPNDDLMSIFSPYAVTTGKILGPFFLVLLIGAVVVKRLEVGAVFAKEALKPKMTNLSPSNAIKMLGKKLNPFAPKTMMELAKSLAKLAVVTAVGMNVILKRKDDLFSLLGVNMDTGLAVMGSVIMEILINVCLVMLLIGFIDKKYQDYEFNKSIKMSKQEVKDEWKNTEGDPVVKGKIRSIQMKFAQQKMMGGVKAADVVVTNPTHYAVALKYDNDKNAVPRVVAKGVDFIAFKIREVAKNNNVPIVENRPLARSLYKLVPIDGIIPPELYVAVAEVLSYVYKNKGK